MSAKRAREMAKQGESERVSIKINENFRRDAVGNKWNGEDWDREKRWGGI